MQSFSSSHPYDKSFEIPLSTANLLLWRNPLVGRLRQTLPIFNSWQVRSCCNTRSDWTIQINLRQHIQSSSLEYLLSYLVKSKNLFISAGISKANIHTYFGEKQIISVSRQVSWDFRQRIQRIIFSLYSRFILYEFELVY